MKDKNKHKRKKVFGYILGSVALTAIGFMLIPPLIENYGNKLYKSSLKNDEIDFNNLSPKIVKKEKTQEEL